MNIFPTGPSPFFQSYICEKYNGMIIAIDYPIYTRVGTKINLCSLEEGFLFVVYCEKGAGRDVLGKNFKCIGSRFKL
jgi:hypothetical protein